MAKPQLDETDLELLAALTRDADITNKALAHRLGLAESTCAHRVRSLRERGVIRDTRIRVDGADFSCGFAPDHRVKVDGFNGDYVEGVTGKPATLIVRGVAL